MPLNREFIGRTYTYPEIYEVSREKIREFAYAIGNPQPLYLDREAARAKGYPDVVAPPTFPGMLFARLGRWPFLDPELGKNHKPYVVQGEQRLIQHRPIHPHDRLRYTTTVIDIRDVGKHELIYVIHEIATEQDEPVCTIHDTGISRGTAAQQNGDGQ